MQQHQRHKLGRQTLGAVAGATAQFIGSTPLGQRCASLFGDRLEFARGFIAHPRQVGSIVPSSKFLERRLIRAADPGRVRTVVELGPGTGGTTRALLSAMRPDARLMALELSPAFRARLVDQIADPRLIVPPAGAEQLAELLGRWRLPPPEVIVSGIPFSTLPADVADRVAAAVIRCLAPGGRFVAYQVRDHVVDLIAPHLGAPVAAWEWLNVPPLRVYRWVKDGAAPGNT